MTELAWTQAAELAALIRTRQLSPVELMRFTLDRATRSQPMPFDLTGLPAISLPCGFADEGLPVELQLVARPGEDAALLRIATLFKAAQGWGWRPALDI